MKSTQKLDQRAWIHAGFRALSKRGPTALKAESLARELGVSKGSFYWHFANIGVFRTAMIDYWVDVATAGIVEAVEAGGGSAQARLERLVHLATEPPPTAVGGPAVEGAIRCWARADNAVGERLQCVEADRIAYCKKLFGESGQAKTLAGQNARLLYAGLIGLEQLQAQGLAKARADLLALLKKVV